ncbi:MAG: DUF3090 domain-containing protein [Chloroflexota bacterium]|nr:DUF3090 domain-containing protein [Chloroflexota bacterium]
MPSDPFESSHDDLDAQRVRVEAIGEPGQRRFRLLTLIDGVTTIVWMEKQQLQALGLALDQLIDQLPDAPPSLGGGNVPTSFDEDTRRQFRVGRMELGYDERRGRFVIVAHDLTDDDTGITLRCRVSREQARELSVDAVSVVSAGRPRCTMCGAPMGPGLHVCPQQNGHLPRALADLVLEDDDE